MIEIKKDDRCSMTFQFDNEDVEAAITAFQVALDIEKIGELCCLFIDNRIFKIKNDNNRTRKLFIKIGNDSFYKENSNCILELDEEVLEYGIEKLQNFMNQGFFKVAEFTCVSMPGIKQSVNLYFLKK